MHSCIYVLFFQKGTVVRPNVFLGSPFMSVSVGSNMYAAHIISSPDAFSVVQSNSESR